MGQIWDAQERYANLVDAVNTYEGSAHKIREDLYGTKANADISSVREEQQDQFKTGEPPLTPNRKTANQSQSESPLQSKQSANRSIDLGAVYQEGDPY